MNIYSVNDSEFCAYGRVVTGLETSALTAALAQTPQPSAGTEYVPLDKNLHSLPDVNELCLHLYGGMSVQLGWCNGYNTKLNCLEYHRSSEFNLGTEDFILLLAKQDEIKNGLLDTKTVKAFRVPAGVLVEIYATTLHYAPCHTNPQKGFRVMVALPTETNTQKPLVTHKTEEDKLLWAHNKWLLAHPSSTEAAAGAYVGLTGENIDIATIIQK